MTAPRRIEPGSDYLLTRRCTQREFLLRPDEDLNAIFAYCLAEAAQRHDIPLITWLVMSNHYHAVIHDPCGRLPAFLEHFHKMVAKAINALRGRRENVWSSEETCVTLLAGTEDVLEKVVYVLTNPVAAHLVDRVTEWPGLHSFDHLDGKPTTHQRPTWFFKAKSKVMPELASLRAVAPPRLSRKAAASWASDVRRAVGIRERRLRAARLKQSIKVRGRKDVLAASPTTRPPKKAQKTKLRPALACRCPKRRQEELARLRGFRVEYARKLDLYVRSKSPADRQKIIFPAGTYRLRSLGIRCAPFDRTLV
jgi:putative transposase